MLDIRDLTVGFGGDAPVIADADLSVEAGQRLLVCGAAGSGKSTLLNVVAGIIPGLVAAPAFAGSVMFCGRPMAELAKDELFSAIASLAQNAEDQLWDLNVEDLIAFPLENRGVAKAAIRDRLQALLTEMELSALRGRRVLTLSGGERRMVAIAAALAAPPDLLVLDEPTTGLDPAARRRLVRLIERLAGQVPALVVSEQDPAALETVADRVALLSKGRLSEVRPAADLMPLRAPWIEAGILPPRRQSVPRKGFPTGGPLLAVDRIRTELRRADGRAVLEDVGFELKAGETVGLIGRNGAGKTTLFQSILGLSKIREGSISIAGEKADGWTPARRARQIAYLPQNMRRILFNMTLTEEVAFAMTAKTGTPDADVAGRARDMLSGYGLGALSEANPFSLSARQQALLGLACAEAAAVRVAILDEPLLARDIEGRRMLDRFLDAMLSAGNAVMLISHDLELIDDVASRTLILEDGRIAFDGATRNGWTSRAFRELGWPAPYADGRGEAA
ncbi:ATP-binding cassette domain-containing protein [Neorhizobium sp. CSC1952]|uniref:ABC transporter ATP-binding protein n=1 Tax=Neorhizobium sp. CSC1952 TaxID=2978974 RepID=UPI0025A64E7E|nr:ATP-binding cassette domain-containing protein [Rhizobium sp. CSC1952]WJR67411.1 ATP-binding cassette domain-containing protein [Rhizobium sp. CSC1952]